MITKNFISHTLQNSSLFFCFEPRNMRGTAGKSRFMKMKNFVEFIRAELISIFSIYENEKLRGIHTSHPIYPEKNI